jgi:hypothetical protein
MEPEYSAPYLQKSATRRYPELIQSNLHINTLFLQIRSELLPNTTADTQTCLFHIDFAHKIL